MWADSTRCRLGFDGSLFGLGDRGRSGEIQDLALQAHTLGSGLGCELEDFVGTDLADGETLASRTDDAANGIGNGLGLRVGAVDLSLTRDGVLDLVQLLGADTVLDFGGGFGVGDFGHFGTP